MTTIEIIMIILSIAFLLLVGFFVPVLLQLWRTAKGMNQTLQLLNQRLPLILENLEEITTNISRTTTTVNLQVAELSLTLRRIQGIMGIFFGLEEVIRRRLGFSRTISTCMSVARGVRVFANSLAGGRPQEKGGKARQ
jgi:uncharacterized protein YoxC